jgi:L-amino acid N-acyltransferase YncA
MLRQATPKDLELLKTHLSESHLVLQGIEEHLAHFWLLFENNTLVASAGLEIYGTVALLRSVAVAKNKRGLGFGKQILEKTLEYASSLGVQELILLTETAPDYFKKLGFLPIPQKQAPVAARASVEFRGACADSAVVMHCFLMQIRTAQLTDAVQITQIYNQGIEDKIATFETKPRLESDILEWFNPTYSFLVAVRGQSVLGFIRASSYRSRDCYARIAEYSIYVAREAQGQGIGDALMAAFIPELQQKGFSKVLSRIFPENLASLALCTKHGFRVVGVYQKHAQLDGVWRDCVIVERLLV